MGNTKSVPLQADDGTTMGNVIEKQWRSEDVTTRRVQGLTEIPLTPTVISTEDEEITITTHPFDQHLAIGGCTSKLELRFVATKSERNIVLDLRNLSPIDVWERINKLRAQFSDQFRVVHEYTVKTGRWKTRTATYSFVVETGRDVYVVWANVIKGVVEKDMANVPVVLVENNRKQSKYDVHVLFPSMPVISNRSVILRWARKISTDMGGNDDILVVCEEEEVKFTGKIREIARDASAPPSRRQSRRPARASGTPDELEEIWVISAAEDSETSEDNL